MQSVEVNGLVFDEYLSTKEISKIVANVAARINRDYAGKEPLFICVLNGAFMYASDLFKRITLPCEITFVRLKSYEGTATTGEVKILTPLTVDVEDRDVIVIEDIIDTGLTMHGFTKQLKDMGANSVELTSFVFKPEALKYPTSRKASKTKRLMKTTWYFMRFSPDPSVLSDSWISTPRKRAKYLHT